MRHLTAGTLALMLALALPASALAWRRPTEGERRAITRVAEHAPHGGGRIYVSHIHVSTVGPWATAELTIYFGSEPDRATDILHKVHATWTNVRVGSSGGACVMPRADAENLGYRGGCGQ